MNFDFEKDFDFTAILVVSTGFGDDKFYGFMIVVSMYPDRRTVVKPIKDICY